LDLFNEVEKYLKDNNLNRAKLALQLGVSKGYITQVLNGDFDHRISKLVELALSIGVVPSVQYKNINNVILEDKEKNCDTPYEAFLAIDPQNQSLNEIALVG
jgi:transcriptional regulator with XRE-family HTH domain